MVKWYGGNPSIEHQDLDSWRNALNKGDIWKFNVYRVPFLFSTLNYDLMDDTIRLIAKHNATAILDWHCLEQFTDEPKLGSPALTEAWRGITNHYKRDYRIKGLELANEPSKGCLIPELVGNNGGIIKALASLTDAVRKISPAKFVIWSPSSFWGNINIPTQYRKINCVNSIHPYSYGKKDNWEALKKIADYRIALADKYALQFSRGVWCGEIECHKSGATTPELEKQYVTYILDACIYKGYGFSYWKYGSTDDYGQDPDQIIAATQYKPKKRE